MSYLGQHEQQARAVKVDLLLDALAVVHGPSPDPNVVRRMSDQAWADLASVAGTNPASQTTREELVKRLERRRAMNPDPFDLFGSGPRR